MAARDFCGWRVVVAAMLMFAFDVAQVVAEQPVDIEAAKRQYAEIIAEELQRQVLPGVSIAWVVDGRIVYEAGFGQADWDRNLPAGADTVYRAGSISKLFNAVAAMQLVERGLIDLDAPIHRALPDFRIGEPFGDAGPITARQLLCHRSGMIREAPVGGYLDSSEPSLTATVASVSSCALVNPPNSKTRYSNVGPSIVGRALEVITGNSFADYEQEHILNPLQMRQSAFLLNDSLKAKLAKGKMRVARGDGSFAFEAAPEFELGTIPAGNLYTTAGDLARFALWVMNDAADATGPKILRRETLRQMCAPQLTSEAKGFGLGFAVGQYRNHKSIGHMGAVYGFTSSWQVLPEQRIGVVVLSNSDICVGPVKRLADAAMDLLLKAVLAEDAPAPPAPVDLTAATLIELIGEYESPGYWARLEVVDGQLRGELSGQPIALTPVGPLSFVADGRIMLRSPVEFERAGKDSAQTAATIDEPTKDGAAKNEPAKNEAGSRDDRVVGFKALGQMFRRVDPAPANSASPAPVAPELWRTFVGSYGPRCIPLVVSLRRGRLYALAENEYDYCLTPINRVSFRMPPGMYDDEQVVFQLDPSGKAVGAILANMYLPRRD